MKSVPVLDRFWAKVDVRGEDECWEWQGARNGGYGQLWLKPNTIRATRLSAAIHFGMFDQRLQVNHACDNPPCVNPAHLRLGTQVENMQEKIQRGRDYQQAKTHCSNGHPFDEVNTHVNTSGVRCCRACRREASRAYRQRLVLHSRLDG